MSTWRKGKKISNWYILPNTDKSNITIEYSKKKMNTLIDKKCH